MVLIVGGIFIGILTIVFGLGWFGIPLYLWAILMIAAGVRDCVQGRPPGQI